MIQAIIFDCFGVLTTDNWRAFIDGLPEGIDIQQARSLNKAVDAGIITHDEFAAGVKDITGQTPPSIEKMLQQDIVKNNQLLAYIKELKSSYKIGLLSNISSNWIRDAFLTTEEQALFDDMIFSHEVGMTKPDPRIFELACEHLGVEPASAVMVDDIDVYCDAARELGMPAVTYENFGQFQTDLEAVLYQP